MEENKNNAPSSVAPTKASPHNNHKVVLVGVVLALLLIIGGSIAVLRTNKENEDSRKTITTTEQSNESNEKSKLSSNFLDSYTIDDTGFGTKVVVTVDSETGTRNIMRNALPNHETGEFPNEGNPNTITEQELNETYPLNPTYTGNAEFARTIGIAINGVKLEPDTAERVTCETGEVHSIEAIQDLTNLGLDFNNAHVQPTGEYHYHGASDLLVGVYDLDQDLVHVAFAADGHQIYYSKSGAYRPSYKISEGQREGSNCTYTEPGPSGGGTITIDGAKDGSLKSDWEFNDSYGDLDECNGIRVGDEYIYLMTDTYPYIGRCLNGEFTESAPGGNGEEPNNQPQGPPPPNGIQQGPPR